MSLDFEHITQWQTMRYVTANDTPITEWAPAKLTAAKKLTMVRVAPATMILIQPLVLGDDGGTFVLAISGWMDHSKNDVKHGGPGPGMRLYAGTLVAGNRAWTSDVPHNSRPWATGAWRIIDEIPASDPDMAKSFGIVVANQDGLLVLPTLGYTHLLPEISSMTNVTAVGLLYRQIAWGDVVTKTDLMNIRTVPA